MGWKLYETLEIPRNASKEEIKRAYKKKAIETHPDKGGDPEVFKAVNNAYSILSDDQNKNRYDQLGDEGYEANGGGGGGGGGGMHVDPNDIFNQFFGHGFNFHFNQHQRGNQAAQGVRRGDHRHVIKITLDEAYVGLKKNIRVILHKTCHSCRERCYACQGQGQITEMIRMGFFTQMTSRQCGNCHGSGMSIKGNTDCKECKGNGKYQEEKIIEINIPAGADNDHHIQYIGLGEQPLKTNDVPGDLWIDIQIEPHAKYTRQGNDLHLTIPISWKESIVGKRIVIDHFNGNFQIYTLELGILQTSKQYIIRGKGMPIKNTSEYGNLIVHFDIQYPTTKINTANAVRLQTLLDEIGIE